jgi:hypothetical protein
MVIEKQSDAYSSASIRKHASVTTVVSAVARAVPIDAASDSLDTVTEGTDSERTELKLVYLMLMVPTGFFRQATESRVGAYVPAGQGSHTPAVVFANVPSGQDVHCALWALDTWPARHELQKESPK